MSGRCTRRQATKGTLLMACLVLSGTACDQQPVSPVAPQVTPALQASAGITDRPYYFYEGHRIDLKIDPGELLVSTAVQGPDAVRQALAARGIPVTEARPVPAASGHWLIRLAAGASLQATEEAYTHLRADPQFRFTSYAYQTLDESARGFLLDHVIVRFKDGVSPFQVDSLATALGLRIVREPKPDSAHYSYWLQYPSDSASDPLAIAALLYRHPLVASADPDMISNAHLMSVPSDPYFGSQFFLKSTIAHNGIPVDDNVEPAWNLTLGSSAIKVTIVGDGADFYQQDLGFGAGAQGTDEFYPCSYPDCVAGEGAIFPVHNDTHGTSVGGIITGRMNNGIGGTGIAPNVVLNVARIFRNDYPTPEQYR